MTKLNMELTDDDKDKIERIKMKFGLTQNTEVIRFCIASMFQNLNEKKITT